MTAHEGSEFVRHIPCAKCGSSDANSLYTDGHQYCFACSNHKQGDGSQAPASKRRGRVAGLISGEIRGLRARQITDETCKHFGYAIGSYKRKKDTSPKTVQIAPYYDADGKLVAQKIRFADKDFLVLGDIKEALPFGAHCFPKTGKMIVVCEGEIDAMTMSQVQGNKWPVVSIACGADNPVDKDGDPLPMNKIRRYIAKHREYFNGFEKVVLMFDMDDQGRESAKVAASVLGSRAAIAELPLKDANDMLVAGRTEELVNAMWRAKPYRPEGIVDMASLKEAVKTRPTWGLSWPLPSLTKLTYGIRTGEIYALGAGTGVGKTDLFTQTIAHIVQEHKQPVGVFSLEQSPKETATRIAGKFAQRIFHVPDSGWTEAELDAAWDKLATGGQVFLYDSFGNNDWDVIKEQIEYMHHSDGVRYFFIDHLTALAAWKDDERKALEVIMSEMGGLVKKLDISIFLISHLATPEGKPHEEGGRVMIRHFKGSRAIGFWCHYMFGLERDQQAAEEEVRLTTTFRCLKDRYTGRATGEVFYMGYDRETGMLFEKEQIALSAESEFEDETGNTKEDEF